MGAWDNPMGTDGFEFIEYAAPDPVAMGRLFERMGFRAIARHRRKKVILYRQGDDQLHPQCGAGQVRTALRPAARPLDLRDRLPRADAGRAYRRATALGAWGFDSTVRADGAEHPAIKGIGDSLIYLVDRWRGKDGAQPARSATSASTTSTSSRWPAPRNSRGPRPDLHRSPDAQRAPRPHGRVAGLLRAPVQLPRDPLLRHRGPGHRHQVQGDDQPLRQDPHPDQRGRQRARPARSRSTWTSTTARASSTSRWAPRTSTRPSRRSRGPGSCSWPRPTPTTS